MPSNPNRETELTNRLWEASVEADWPSVYALCDEYAKTVKHEHRRGEGGDVVRHWSESDAALSAAVDGLDEEHRRKNPLMAAVLHVAVDVAASRRSFSLFSNPPGRDAVDAEERRRARSRSTTGGGLAAAPNVDADDRTTPAEFCPYFQMSRFGNGRVVDDEHRRARRKAVAALCRTNPLWALLPMTPRGEAGRELEDAGTADEDLPRGTTPLHVAVRMRNSTLVRLLVKHCPKAAEVADVDGCLPLHHAVMPSDKMAVLRRAVSTYQSNIGGGTGDAPPEAGPNEVHCGANLYHRGRVLLGAVRESTELGRYRVSRLQRNHGVRQRRSRILGSALARRSPRFANTTKRGGNESNGNEAVGSNSNPAKTSEDREGGIKTRKHDESENSSSAFPNMYESPSSLVRALMHLGTVEEDSVYVVQSEWSIHAVGREGDGLQEARKSALAAEYPIVVDRARTATRGLGRATRPWRTERQRADAVRLLTSIHPQGMLYQCDDGGDTPLILACQTLLGDEGEDAEFGDLGEDDLDDDQLDEIPENRNEPVPDEVGEDDADYEMDLPRPNFEAVRPDADSATGAREPNNQAAADRDDGVANGQQQPGLDNGEDDPLEAVLFMIAKYGGSAIPDDDGDTALHAATRIGASPRLVRRLLDAMPALASTPAEDGSTPLHLACRRACHLAPEGNGGMGTYDAAVIRALADAAGAGALTSADDEGRTPFHVACRYKASPDVLAELADSDGGADSLLIRDTEGHAPLGVYCRHANDYHGLQVLVSRCPDAAAAMGDGRQLPLHRILSTFNLAVNIDCLRLIGNAYPRGLDSTDSRGMTPLALLCESYRAPLNVDIPKLRRGRTTLERCLSKKIWLMARYLILSARANRRWKAWTNTDNATTGPQPTELVLHAALREPSSSVEIVQLATVVHADQLRETDANGETPLHLCCRRKQSGRTVNSTLEDDEGSTGDALYDEGIVVFKRVNEGVTINEGPVNLDSSPPNPQRQHRYNPCRDYLLILYHILLSDVSAAGRCNDEGQYPFNLLVDKGTAWREGGVDRVLKAFPHALFSYELSNGLFAMALARTASHPPCSNPDRLREEEASSIGATFQLLRGKPAALEGANLTAPSKSGGEGRKSKRARTK